MMTAGVHFVNPFFSLIKEDVLGKAYSPVNIVHKYRRMFYGRLVYCALVQGRDAEGGAAVLLSRGFSQSFCRWGLQQWQDSTLVRARAVLWHLLKVTARVSSRTKWLPSVRQNQEAVRRQNQLVPASRRVKGAPSPMATAHHPAITKVRILHYLCTKKFQVFCFQVLKTLLNTFVYTWEKWGYE